MRVSGCLPRPTCLLLLSLLLGVIPTTTGDARDARDARDVEHLTVITSSPACYTLVTDTGTVGCRSTTPGGSEAPLVQLDSAAALGQFAAGALGAEGTVLLPFELFTRASMLDLKRSGRCRGVLLAAASSPPASFSPAPPLPYSKCDGGGSGAAWNPPGNSLSEMDFDFPIVWLSANETVKVQEKAAANKARGAGGFPRYVVRMRYAMDVFQGSRFGAGEWWELQARGACCASCKADCGEACCDQPAGFRCASQDTNASLPWRAPVCARPRRPTAESCLREQTCLPLGGYNVWSLNAPALPLPPKQRLIVATAPMDSSAFFHARAPGASSAASAVALIAAADALRPLASQMRAAGGPVLLFLLLQGTAWDQLGARKFREDVLSFRCKKLKGPFEGTTSPNAMCLDPLMLSPEIEQINMTDIDFVLELDQVGTGQAGDPLFLHAGCAPSADTTARVASLLSPSPPGGASPVKACSPGLPLPATSAIATAFLPQASTPEAGPSSHKAGPSPGPEAGPSGDGPEAGPRGAAVLAGYDASFATPFFRSAFDTRADPAAVCAAATATARALFTLASPPPPATPLAPPTTLTADCALVSKLLLQLLPPSSPPGAPAPLGTAYSSIYVPPTRRGPSRRETFLRDALASANRVTPDGAPHVPPPSACDCCNADAGCAREAYRECLDGACVSSFSFFHDALAPGVSWDSDEQRFVLSNASSSSSPEIRGTLKRLWAESNWQANVGAEVYLQDAPSVEEAGAAAGVVLTVAAAAATYWLLSYYNRHFKQS